MEDKRFQKSPCRKCGTPCYHLCYVGNKLVCLDCFDKDCRKRLNKKRLNQMNQRSVNNG